MDGFFQYLDYVTSADFVRSFIRGFSVVMDFMLTTFTVPGYGDFSVLSLVMGGGILIYLTWTILKYLLPF